MSYIENKGSKYLELITSWLFYCTLSLVAVFRLLMSLVCIYTGTFINISFHLHLKGCYNDTLKLSTVGVFTPQNWQALEAVLYLFFY
jgi:hypothetical protein